MLKDKNEKYKIYPETPHLIFCEGKDEYFFLIWLLDYLKPKEPAFTNFRVYDFGGINELKLNLSNIAKTEGFKKNVKSLCILRDAETNAAGACQSIKAAFADCNFSVPAGPCSRADGSDTYPHIATGFALFPDFADKPKNGTLEDLCLRILAKNDSKDVLAHVDAALTPYKKHLPQLHKNRLHTYFSLTKEFVSLKIGEAAKDKAFRYDVPEIDSLKSFLLQMAGEVS
jgi:hypothetical protein